MKLNLLLVLYGYFRENFFIVDKGMYKNKYLWFWDLYELFLDVYNYVIIRVDNLNLSVCFRSNFFNFGL